MKYIQIYLTLLHRYNNILIVIDHKIKQTTISATCKELTPQGNLESYSNPWPRLLHNLQKNPALYQSGSYQMNKLAVNIFAIPCYQSVTICVIIFLSFSFSLTYIAQFSPAIMKVRAGTRFRKRTGRDDLALFLYLCLCVSLSLFILFLSMRTREAYI